jgi:hypothetical protein
VAPEINVFTADIAPPLLMWLAASAVVAASHEEKYLLTKPNYNYTYTSMWRAAANFIERCVKPLYLTHRHMPRDAIILVASVGVPLTIGSGLGGLQRRAYRRYKYKIASGGLPL